MIKKIIIYEQTSVNQFRILGDNIHYDLLKCGKVWEPPPLKFLNCSESTVQNFWEGCPDPPDYAPGVGSEVA